MSMNRMIMSISPQINYTVTRSFSIDSRSSAVSDLPADGHERKCSNILFSYRR